MNRAYLYDLIERALRTFIQAFAASLAGSEIYGDWSVYVSAAVAGFAAALALVLGVITKPVASPSSASVLPLPTAGEPAKVPDPTEPVNRTGEPVRIPGD